MNNEAFTRAILETPEDDGPRLLYADWLDDHADGVRGVHPPAGPDRTLAPDDDRLSGLVAHDCRISDGLLRRQCQVIQRLA